MAWWVISQDVFWTHQSKAIGEGLLRLTVGNNCYCLLHLITGENPTEKITLLVSDVYFFFDR